MEYRVQKSTAEKRKRDGDQDNLKSKKNNVVASFEVLSKEYFDMCMTDLEKMLTHGFAEIRSEIFSLKAKLNFLEQNFKTPEKVKKFQPCDMGMVKDLKSIFDTSGSTDSSIEIVSVTPAKIDDGKKMNKIDMQLKAYGMLLDTGEEMGRNKKALKLNLYDPFAVADQCKAAWLDSWMTINRDITVNLGIIKADKKFFSELIEPRSWLSEEHIDVGMSLMRRELCKVSCPFANTRLAFLDVPLTILISKNYQKFLENPMNFDWSSEFINYYNGVLPRFERTNKRLGVDVDEAFVVLNIKNVHWIALAISMLHRNIRVYDSAILLSSDDEIIEFVKPFAVMFPHLIKSLASPADQII